ncbi:uncharacterized protein C2845_PM11G03250 [Panicum miliaceum]|uniref:Uncharacterized protein n=1 Tax=Panicum miliaceum TaxID=4540 RepID=A0A3L6RN05_PANMI|nr:uncharacterized protein C2845_PM11G03250 [Panicum miliaceum]
MNSSESSTSVRGRGKNKRKWVPAEDDVLIKALHDVSLDPRWRSDGSFKNGYTSVLEARLAEKLPGAKISAIPHVESRLRYFKSKYSALEELLKKSGFTWDSSKNMLQCEKQQYDDHCKNHPDAKGLYGVPFPYYDVLAAIYSKDIATGEGAEDLTDAINNMEQELAAGNGNDEEEEEAQETPRRFVDSTSSSSKKRKKEWKWKKDSVTSDPLLDMFNEVSGDLKVVTKSIGKMAQTMERDTTNQEKSMNEDPQQKLREKAVNEVRRLKFTGAEVIQAALIFAKMPDQMGMMFALPEPLRREYIVNMLHDEAQRKERQEKKKKGRRRAGNRGRRAGGGGSGRRSLGQAAAAAAEQGKEIAAAAEGGEGDSGGGGGWLGQGKEIVAAAAEQGNERR